MSLPLVTPGRARGPQNGKRRSIQGSVAVLAQLCLLFIFHSFIILLFWYIYIFLASRRRRSLLLLRHGSAASSPVHTTRKTSNQNALVSPLPEQHGDHSPTHNPPKPGFHILSSLGFGSYGYRPSVRCALWRCVFVYLHLLPLSPSIYGAS